MNFAYHFYGNHIGTLNVLQQVSGKLRKVWSLSGDQGNGWHVATVPLKQSKNFVIHFNATHANGYQGDMALDDISFHHCDPSKTANGFGVIRYCLSVYLSVYLSVCLSVSLSLHVCLSVCVSLSLCLSVSLSVHLSVSLYVPVSVCGCDRVGGWIGGV